MSLDRDWLGSKRRRPLGSRARKWIAISASVTLAIGVFASLAPARFQDPGDAQPKQKAAIKKAKAEVEPTQAAPPEPAPDATKKVEAPPPPGFSKAPKTPSEVWEVVDFFLRSGQVDVALPYLKQFVTLNADDAAYLRLRDEFGEGSFLRLGDFDQTRSYMKPLVDQLSGAIRRHTLDPARIQTQVGALAKSDVERSLAIRDLRPAGSFAVPAILQAWRTASTEDRGKIADALGRLDLGAIPALVAILDSKDEAEVNAAAAALGRISDRRAIPDLLWIASRPAGAGKQAAAAAVTRLTGHAADSAVSSASILAAEARRYYTRSVAMNDPATVWLWDDMSSLPAVKSLPKREALAASATRYAREALELDPANLDAQLTLLSLALERAPAGTIPPSVLAAGAEVLGKVVHQSILDQRPDVTARAIEALGKVTDRNALGATARSHALLEALGSSDRRVQFAAAEAIVNLEPKAAFPGSSSVVPILARFAANPRQSGAILIDGNPVRASQVAGYLQPLGLDVQTCLTGEEGFRKATSAHVELILMNPSYLAGAWKSHDTLANLKADVRTSGLPVFLIGPLKNYDKLMAKGESFPGVHFLVTPTESVLLREQIERALKKQDVLPLTEQERAAYALKASQLLTKISQTKGSPFASDLAAVEPDLVLALNHSATAEAAATALGNVPGHDAQRNLAAAVLDSSRPAQARLKSADALLKSLRRFGPLLTAQQEAQFTQLLQLETDPALQQAIATIIGALKPKPAAVGRMLRADISIK